MLNTQPSQHNAFTAFAERAQTESSDIDDRTIGVSLFENEFAQTISYQEMTLPELCKLILETTRRRKAKLPLLKLAQFGDQRTNHNCLRANDNVLYSTGIAGDYDKGKISIEAARAVLERANIRCVLHTSRSHTPEKPRWRVLAPFSRPLPPTEHARMVTRLNGLFGGALAPESFVLSQPYFFGSVNHNPDHQAVVLDGDHIDLRDDLDAGAIGKGNGALHGALPGPSIKSADDDANAFSGYDEHEPADEAEVSFALDQIPSDDYRIWMETGAGLASEFSEQGFELFEPWSKKSEKYGWRVSKSGEKTYDPAFCREKWDEFAKLKSYSIGTVFHYADKANPDWREQWRTLDRRVARHHALLENSKPDVHWPEPVDLWANFDPPELPTGLLPALIERFAVTEGENMGCDPAGLAMAALTVCAAAIPDHVQLRMKQNSDSWTESARLWTMLVANVSGMKTPIINRATSPLKKIDAELYRQYAAELQRWEALPAEQRGERPRQRRLVLGDTTIEAAQAVFADNPGGVLLIQDEISGWFGSMDKYSGTGAAKDRGFWLESYNGGQYRVDRVRRGSIFIENLSASMLGGIQPDKVRQHAADGVDDGLLQRGIPIILKAATADRDVVQDAVNAEYGKLVELLNTIGPERLQFDDAAQAIRRQQADKHLALINCDAVAKKFAAHIGKYNGIFGRLCIVFHGIETARRQGYQAIIPLVVTGDTARRVAEFMDKFMLPHAICFYAGVLGLADDHERLANVAGFILAKGLARIDSRTIQHGNRDMRRMKRRDIEDVFDQLHAFGWIDRQLDKNRNAHGVVNPEVHTRFAARAEAERARVATIREAIAVTVKEVRAERRRGKATE